MYAFFFKTGDTIIDDSVELSTATAMQPTDTLNEPTETSPRTHVSVSTQTTVPKRSETATRSDVFQRSYETMYGSTHSSQTKPTARKATKKTITLTTVASPNEYTTIGINVTLSVPNKIIVTIGNEAKTVTELSSISTKVTIHAPIHNASINLKTVTTTATPLIIRTTKQLTINDNHTSQETPFCSPPSPDYCECVAEGTWTIVQKRFDGSVDFYRNWTEYKEGFGDENGEFWLGNDVLHHMTSSAKYSLKIYVTDRNNMTKYAVYDTFGIADETDGYRLTIDGYCGDAGDSMIFHQHGQMFSTNDRDNDNSPMHCAQSRHGAWWYHNCGKANLNGRYYYDNSNLRVDGINWLDWYLVDLSTGHSLKETTMMIKQVL